MQYAQIETARGPFSNFLFLPPAPHASQRSFRLAKIHGATSQLKRWSLTYGSFLTIVRHVESCSDSVRRVPTEPRASVANPSPGGVRSDSHHTCPKFGRTLHCFAWFFRLIKSATRPRTTKTTTRISAPFNRAIIQNASFRSLLRGIVLPSG